MEEYGIMEYLGLENQMRAVDEKQRIYLEWPKENFKIKLRIIERTGSETREVTYA